MHGAALDCFFRLTSLPACLPACDYLYRVLVCARAGCLVACVVRVVCGVQQLKEFADLLDKIFILDPAKRTSVTDCLKHPFIKDLPA